MKKQIKYMRNEHHHTETQIFNYFRRATNYQTVFLIEATNNYISVDRHAQKVTDLSKYQFSLLLSIYVTSCMCKTNSQSISNVHFSHRFSRIHDNKRIELILRENHHASVVWNWHHRVAIADSADVKS